MSALQVGGYSASVKLGPPELLPGTGPHDGPIHFAVEKEGRMVLEMISRSDRSHKSKTIDALSGAEGEISYRQHED